MLFVLLVGGVVGYVWYSGQREPATTVQEDAEKPVQRATQTTVEMAENTPVGVYIQAFPDSVSYGQMASVQVHTRSDATCRVTISYDRKTDTDVGLEEKVAGQYGLVSWQWTIDQSIPRGEWPVTVTCEYGEKSGVMVADLVVE